MFMTDDAIRSVVLGAERIEKTMDGWQFLRYTEEQADVFRANPNFFRKTFAGSGIRLDFETDAVSFSFDYTLFRGSSRAFGYADVEVDGFLTAHTGIETIPEEGNIPGSCTVPVSRDGAMHRVTLHLPPLAKMLLRNLKLEGKHSIVPVKPEKTILMYGDSITQGYDAYFPSCTYYARIAKTFRAEIFNKALGGDVFNPSLAACREDVKPDLITVAYGTNDWTLRERNEVISACREFLQNLRSAHPDAPVAVILPIWRKDCASVTKCGAFSDIAEIITGAAEGVPGVHFIDGDRLLPHVPELFSDGYLHPNDLGFQYYGENLVRELAPLLRNANL